MKGILLRHLGKTNGDARLNSDLAAQALLSLWPEYRKGMPASELAARIDQMAIERAASDEPDLLTFLRAIGFAGKARVVVAEFSAVMTPQPELPHAMVYPADIRI